MKQIINFPKSNKVIDNEIWNFSGMLSQALGYDHLQLASDITKIYNKGEGHITIQTACIIGLKGCGKQTKGQSTSKYSAR